MHLGPRSHSVEVRRLTDGAFFFFLSHAAREERAVRRFWTRPAAKVRSRTNGVSHGVFGVVGVTAQVFFGTSFCCFAGMPS